MEKCFFSTFSDIYCNWIHSKRNSSAPWWSQSWFYALTVCGQHLHVCSMLQTTHLSANEFVAFQFLMDSFYLYIIFQVVNEVNLLKKTKLIFFNPIVLSKLTILCKNTDDNVQRSVSKLLLRLCTDVKRGICFVPRDEDFTGRCALFMFVYLGVTSLLT